MLLFLDMLETCQQNSHVKQLRRLEGKDGATRPWGQYKFYKLSMNFPSNTGKL